MSVQQDTRDRLIKLETEVAAMRKDFDSVNVKVTEMHTLLLQARGAKWFIIAAAGLGGFISAKLAAFLPWFPR